MEARIERAIKLVGGVETDWKIFENGGGVVNKTATVGKTAFLGEQVIVAGDGQVCDGAVLDGDMIVDGNVREV